MLGLNKREVYLSLISSAGGVFGADGGAQQYWRGAVSQITQSFVGQRRTFYAVSKDTEGVRAMGRGHGGCWRGHQGTHA